MKWYEKLRWKFFTIYHNKWWGPLHDLHYYFHVLTFRVVRTGRIAYFWQTLFWGSIFLSIKNRLYFDVQPEDLIIIFKDEMGNIVPQDRTYTYRETSMFPDQEVQVYFEVVAPALGLEQFILLRKYVVKRRPKRKKVKYKYFSRSY